MEMNYLQGDTVLLRALEPGDLEFLYAMENDPGIWGVSGTLAPYSRKVLKDYLDRAHLDIYEARQLRLAINSRRESHLVGLVDLYDFDPVNLRAGVGILISARHRGHGFGSQALRVLCDYAFGVLQLHQVYASVGVSNAPSLGLFRKAGFRETGIRLHWLRTPEGFEDEVFFQKFRENVS